MGELGALFNPGMRHELEERQAKAARREEEGNARDGDLRIDLESGVAVINIPGADDDQPSAPVAETDTDTDTDTDQAAPTAESDNEAGAQAAGSGNDEPTTGAEVEEAPPALRPRGKRGLSASHR